ncbi:hypothetical protein [Cerasicoccus frondis]|uniref:hypothetical protein n=1 Tax=Cerasicoccus frondis TaxID=490090 RepID=UPI0028526555|nr:hypothetical protein [Cerasicoccus frondis]
MPEAIPHIRELIPHEPPMVLIDHITQLDQNHVCGETTLSPGSLDANGHGVPAAWSLEIVAQACAALIGHCHRHQGFRGGRLIKSTRWELNAQHLPTEQLLTVKASLDAASELGVFMFNGALHAGSIQLAAGQLTILAK